MTAPTQPVGSRLVPPQARARSVKTALMIVLALNAVSVALEIAVGARTGALTVLGAALESTLDMLSNGVAILAVSIASRAPDDDHPYGHEKFETLGTLGIVAFLAITCFELMRQSIVELRGGHSSPTASWADGWLLVVSLAVNAFVGLVRAPAWPRTGQRAAAGRCGPHGERHPCHRARDRFARPLSSGLRPR